jgi:tetratricopeptide (TPR) repeat protein
MGVVCLAEREDTGAPVAIKFLLHAGMSAPRREGFSREIKTLAKLKHPYIARLYDAGTLADGTPWFVMEYVEGIRLTDFCRQKDLSIVDRLRLFRAVCEAVQHAYRQGIIHRDLKPSNILVEKDGTPRLLDFGIARQLQNADETERSTSGLRFGSVEYAAPEWIRDGLVGAYTDVYSLGVILFEMLAGRLPQVADEHPPEKPSSASSGKAAWGDLDALCLKAINRDFQQRYQSVEELLRDVDHYLKCEPLEARRSGWGYRAGKFVRRNRRAVLAASLVGTLVLGLVVFFTVRLARARNAALAEVARTKRVEKFMEDLFEGGNEEVGPSADLKVVTVIDHGVEKLPALNRDPEVQAHLYQTLGTVYQSLGLLDRADALLHTALERLKSVYGPDHPEVADNLKRLSLLRGDQARFPEAERLAREALAIDRRHLPPGAPELAEDTAVLGKALVTRGRYEEAIGVLNDAIGRASARDVDPAVLLGSRTLLAVAQFHLGHYAAADALNLQILAADRRLHGERHPDVAIDFMNLGNIQYQWGHYPEAEGYFRSAVKITRAWSGPNHPDTADMTSYVAQTLIAEGRYDEAESLERPAMEALQKAYPKGLHPRLAMALDQLGGIAQHRGRLREAEDDYSRMAAIYRAVYGDGDARTAAALSGLAGVYSDEGQSAKAEKLLRDVVRSLSAALPAGHLNIGVARIKLGRVLLREKHYGDAEGESLAGYEIAMKQSNPPAKWLQYAREDLIAVYDALHQPEKAAALRSRMAAAGPGSAKESKSHPLTPEIPEIERTAEDKQESDARGAVCSGPLRLRLCGCGRLKLKLN